MLSPKLDWEIANPIWASTLNPFLNNLLNQVQILKNVPLISGETVLNHKLGRVMNGWFLIDVQGPATIYRSAPFNKYSLSLTSSAAVTVSIGVF